MNIISFALLMLLAFPLFYWLLLAFAALRSPKRVDLAAHPPQHHFAIAIPAHDEDTVIAKTVQRLCQLDYPKELIDIHIVADHCSDDTAVLARGAGALVHERNEGPRTGKGAALSWLFQRVLEDENIDALVIFDADTHVDLKFLQWMNAHLLQGDQVIQGQHVIRNPEQGWFAALTWAMFIIDNHFQNQGRVNLGWSAKHMGDSICFRAEVLRKMGWGHGLTEDFQLRQRLLLENICIAYEPEAKGLGEAPQTWLKAYTQRSRWLRGTVDASKTLGPQLFKAALRTRNGPMWDGVMQAYFPSYSTLSLLSLGLMGFQIILNLIWPGTIHPMLVAAWIVYAIILFFYPLFGLLQARAPFKAYMVILSGPIFIVWRTWLAAKSRFTKESITWKRTAHGEKP